MNLAAFIVGVAIGSGATWAFGFTRLARAHRAGKTRTIDLPNGGLIVTSRPLSREHADELRAAWHAQHVAERSIEYLPDPEADA